MAEEVYWIYPGMTSCYRVWMILMTRKRSISIGGPFREITLVDSKKSLRMRKNWSIFIAPMRD